MQRQFIFCFLLCGAFVGCSTGGSQLATCKAEKEQLLTTIRSQRDTARTQNEKLVSLESRLDQAEKELARSGGSGTRLSSVPQRANEVSSSRLSSVPLRTNEVPASSPRSDLLPWRSPGAKTESAPKPSLDSPRSAPTSSSTAPRGSLTLLAKRDNRVRYDASARAAEIETQVQFDDKSATISAAGKRQLDEVARLLRSDEARDLPIVVAAPDAAQAKAVADYLDRHGIPEERLAVSTAARQPGGTTKAATSGGVQVFVLDSEAAVADWGTKTGLRR